MDSIKHFLGPQPSLGLIYLPALIFFLICVFCMFRIYKRIYKTAESDPGRALGSIISLAQKIGINVEAIGAIRDSMLGEKIKDIAVVEKRRYRRMIIEHSLHLYKKEGRKNIVLRVHEYIDRPRLTDWLMAVKNVYYFPLGEGAWRALAGILGQDEQTFLRTVEEYGAVNVRKRKSWLKNLFQRIFFAQIMKDLGIIESKSTSLRLKSGKKCAWSQKISASLGKEKDESLLILKFVQKYSFPPLPFNIPRGAKYILYYPFGAPGREHFRKIIAELETYMQY